MANVKTAISLQETLFRKADGLATELHVSRSQLFALAMEKFIREYENQKMVEALNAVYTGEPDPEAKIWLAGAKRLYRHVLEADTEW